MSLTTALTGLNAAQTDISATANNIANVGTVGFRGSRAEFADVYNASPYSVPRTTVGSGVQVTRVAQDFSQGSVVATGNRLDLAIEGAGFFALRPPQTDSAAPPQTVYSRAGALAMSPDGVIVNASGQQLLGWPVGTDGRALSEAMELAGPMRIPMAMGTPVATTAVTLSVSLPSDPTMAGGQAAVPPGAAFDPADSSTWAHRTPVPMIDGQGRALSAEAYFVRTSNPSVGSPDTTYTVHLVVEDVQLPATGAATLSLGADGKPVAATAPLTFTSPGGLLTLDLGGSDLQDEAFQVAAASHDGAEPADLSAIEIDQSGTVWASYGSDTSHPIAKLLLVNFPTPQGLRNLGGAAFAATPGSGEPAAGVAGASGMGLIRSGALERSNIDLTEEMVNLISAQRNYQASAKALETSTSMMQTIMNIRS